MPSDDTHWSGGKNWISLPASSRRVPTIQGNVQRQGAGPGLGPDMGLWPARPEASDGFRQPQWSMLLWAGLQLRNIYYPQPEELLLFTPPLYQPLG